MKGGLTYFVADVHLGCDVLDPADRERRFVDFLNSLPDNTSALYMLGDVWDFWYEYRDVVPRGYVKVFAALISLVERGVEVYFFRGNHDQWTYSYLESMGVRILEQPCLREIDGRKFCLATEMGWDLYLRVIKSCRAYSRADSCVAFSVPSIRG